MVPKIEFGKKSNAVENEADYILWVLYAQHIDIHGLFLKNPISSVKDPGKWIGKQIYPELFRSVVRTFIFQAGIFGICEP